LPETSPVALSGYFKAYFEGKGPFTQLEGRELQYALLIGALYASSLSEYKSLEFYFNLSCALAGIQIQRDHYDKGEKNTYFNIHPLEARLFEYGFHELLVAWVRKVKREEFYKLDPWEATKKIINNEF
jgi:hypothetical protein